MFSASAAIQLFLEMLNCSRNYLFENAKNIERTYKGRKIQNLVEMHELKTVIIISLFLKIHFSTQNQKFMKFQAINIGSFFGRFSKL